MSGIYDVALLGFLFGFLGLGFWVVGLELLNMTKFDPYTIRIPCRM